MSKRRIKPYPPPWLWSGQCGASWPHVTPCGSKDKMPYVSTEYLFLLWLFTPIPFNQLPPECIHPGQKIGPICQVPSVTPVPQPSGGTIAHIPKIPHKVPQQVPSKEKCKTPVLPKPIPKPTPSPKPMPIPIPIPIPIPVPTPTPTPTPGAPSTTEPIIELPPTPITIEKAVAIKNNAFNPPSLEVLTGTTVVWTNFDNVNHTVTSTDGIFNSGTLRPGESYQYTFNVPGSYPYFCTIHPEMKGIIVVKGLG